MGDGPVRSLRRQRVEVVERATVTTAVASWPGVFLGAAVNGQPVCAGPDQAVLVLGPPRSGKTTGVVIPSVLSAPGAVVSTSTKLDVLQLTGVARGRRGRCWLFDPSGTVAVPTGVTRLGWSPVPGAEQWSEAVATAHALARAGRPGRGLTESDHWSERAEALLAPLLHAAALADLDAGWVLRWVLRREITEPAVLIGRKGGDEIAAETLAGIAATEERERSGIFSTAAGILAAYRSPDALAAANAPNFDPGAFVRSSDTVYLCATGADQEQLAPIIVAFLDRLRRETYRREGGWPLVLWALDEAANIAPLPTLPAVVSEGGGQGLITLACFQDLSQARARWGAAADGFLTLFGVKLILGGVADLKTLQLISALVGDTYVRMTSTTRPTGWGAAQRRTETTSWERRPALPPDRINQLPAGAALLLAPHAPPSPIRLVPCWEAPWREWTTSNERQPDTHALRRLRRVVPFRPLRNQHSPSSPRPTRQQHPHRPLLANRAGDLGPPSRRKLRHPDH
jgi:type IV secretion system protein VirD4